MTSRGRASAATTATATTPAPESPKRAAIVEAAVRLFRAYGFRRTSMDAIAQEARVAKPTVYAHFADKDALFVAVCAAVMDDVLRRTEAARAEGETAIARVAGMVAAKFSRIFEIVHTSPHAKELLESQNALAKRVVDEGDEKYAALLLKELQRDMRAKELDPSRLGCTAPELVRLLHQLGHGAGYAASSAAEHRDNVFRLVTAMLTPAAR